jgi:hypothetical protein
MEKRYKSDVHGEVSDLHHFIKRNATKFLETGSVFNKAHHPDTKKVSDDVAREAATQLKAGYISNRKVTGGKARACSCAPLLHRASRRHVP